MGKDIWEDYWRNGQDHGWWQKPAPEVQALIASQSPSLRPRVLDLGCGLGRHAIAFALAGFDVTATDASRTAVEQLHCMAGEAGIKVQTRICDMLDQGFGASSFDIVVAYNVIYHGLREQFAKAIVQIAGLLRPRGLFFFTCPTRADGKYGEGTCVAPNTYLSPNSVTPGDIHYFADEYDLKTLLKSLFIVRMCKDEGYWDNKGRRQFCSNWQVTAEKRVPLGG